MTHVNILVNTYWDFFLWVYTHTQFYINRIEADLKI